MVIREATCADVAAIARVHIESWQTTYRGIIPDAVLADLTVEGRAQIWERLLCRSDRQECVYVAADAAGQVVGFAYGGPERTGDPIYSGELYAIYLLAAAQGQGLGRRLVGAVAARLAEAGFPALLIWALAANPACRFYSALGGQPLRTQSIMIGGQALPEVGFAWPDIRTLVSPGPLP